MLVLPVKTRISSMVPLNAALLPHAPAGMLAVASGWPWVITLCQRFAAACMALTTLGSLPGANFRVML